MKSIATILKSIRVTNKDFKLSDFSARFNIKSDNESPNLEDILESKFENISNQQNKI